MIFNHSQILTKDLFRLKKLWKKIKHSHQESEEKQKLKTKFQQELQKSQQKYLTNKSALPVANLNQKLPVYEQKEALLELIQNNQVVIVCGETGSGKTTQLPQLCLQLGLGARGLIAHTQPRRIAARSVASRLAEELNLELGSAVGYQVRFEEKISASTRIKLMTDGYLLAETSQDPFLNNYEVIIVDEAHERSLNIDFLLGYLKRLLPKRPDLKVIITSATIDADLFAKHFNNAPIIQVSGRTYPVKIEYQTPAEDEDLGQQIERAINYLDDYYQIGDILVFLATEREIIDVQQYLQKLTWRDTEILPLFGRLSAQAQQEIFQPKKARRIILSTNVAETSLTVPRIRYVIDGGMARISRYSLRNKTQRLPIEAISQASANQRAGRCGRLSDGVCIRLYSEEDFAQRPPFTEPEILRTNLAAVILQMLALNLGDIKDFPFLEAPEQRQINDGYRLLFELQALDGNMKLSALGRKMAQLPIEPRFARIIFAAEKLACLQEALIIVAFLSIQDPRERPFKQEALAEQRQGEFVDKQSDFQTLLNLFMHYQQQKHELSNRALKNWCKHYFLNSLRMREWRELVNQLLRNCRDLKLQINSLEFGELSNDKPEGSKGRCNWNYPELNKLHEALLCGFLEQVGLWDERRQDYLSTRQRRFRIFPNSTLARKKVSSVMSANIVETQQVYARICAPIDLFLLEKLAPHLIKSQLQNPHWSKKMGNVMAEETVSLYGLPILSGRKKPYASENMELARQIFIEEALLSGEINTKAQVINDNLKLINELAQLEEKTRSREFVDEQAISDFYQEKIPENVYSVVTLEKWLEKVGDDFIRLQKQDILGGGSASASDYPEYLTIKSYRFKLAYEFNPGSKRDGVSIFIPLSALNALENKDLDYLVPGMLLAKVEALLRRLPKTQRRQLVPIPPLAEKIRQKLTKNEDLLPQLSRLIKELTGIEIPLDYWNLSALETHHLMNICLLDGKNIIVESRDLSALQEQFSQRAAEKFQKNSTASAQTNENLKFLQEKNIKDWLWEKIPQQVKLHSGIIAYPALNWDGKNLQWQLFESEIQAKENHQQGLLFLLKEQLNQELKYLQKNIPQLQKSALYYCKLAANARYFDDLSQAAILQLLDNFLIWNKDDFAEKITFIRKNIIAHTLKLNTLLNEILRCFSAINEELRGLKNSANKNDMTQQLNSLVYGNFIQKTAPQKLSNVLRYLEALLRRIEKFKLDPFKDNRALEALSEWEKIAQQHDLKSENGQIYFEALQEFRIQLFAQELGTKMKVSPQRLQELAQKLK